MTYSDQESQAAGGVRSGVKFWGVMDCKNRKFPQFLRSGTTLRDGSGVRRAFGCRVIAGVSGVRHQF